MLGKFEVGDRVVVFANLLSEVEYIRSRIELKHIAFPKGKTVGTVLGYTQAGDKVAIEFDEPIWQTKYDTHNNGCHGKGKMDHCYYIPEAWVYYETSKVEWTPNQVQVKSTKKKSSRLLLLLC